jgi:hypothetical protein
MKMIDIAAGMDQPGVVALMAIRMMIAVKMASCYPRPALVLMMTMSATADATVMKNPVPGTIELPGAVRLDRPIAMMTGSEATSPGGRISQHPRLLQKVGR